MRALATVLPLLATLSCSSPGTAPAPSEFEPERSAEGLSLTNPTARTIYYAVFEREWAEKGLFIWAQCTDAPRCRSIPPRGAVRVPFVEIDGYSPTAREARVYYWLLVPKTGGGYQVEDLRSFVAPL